MIFFTTIYMENKPFAQMNIENLMPSYNKNYNTRKTLDVYTISHGSKINVEPQKDFDSNELLNSIMNRRQKMRNWLVDMYNQCCYKIKEADNFFDRWIKNNKKEYFETSKKKLRNLINLN